MEIQVEKARSTRSNATGAMIAGALLHVARFLHTHATAHARDGRPAARTSGKCDLEERRGARYDGALQDGRSGEPRLPGERARRGNKKEREKARDQGERGPSRIPGGREEKGDTKKVARRCVLALSERISPSGHNGFIRWGLQTARNFLT